MKFSVDKHDKYVLIKLNESLNISLFYNKLDSNYIDQNAEICYDFETRMLYYAF